MRMKLHCDRHCTNKRSLDEAVVWVEVCGYVAHFCLMSKRKFCARK